MNNEHIIEQFKQVEEKVETLIVRCKTVETQKSQLEERIEEAQSRYNEERNLIGLKINDLLAKLEDI